MLRQMLKPLAEGFHRYNLFRINKGGKVLKRSSILGTGVGGYCGYDFSQTIGTDPAETTLSGALIGGLIGAGLSGVVVLPEVYLLAAAYETGRQHQKKESENKPSCGI